MLENDGNKNATFANDYFVFIIFGKMENESFPQHSFHILHTTTFKYSIKNENKLETLIIRMRGANCLLFIMRPGLGVIQKDIRVHKSSSEGVKEGVSKSKTSRVKDYRLPLEEEWSCSTHSQSKDGVLDALHKEPVEIELCF